MSIAAKIKTEQVIEDISQEINSVQKDDDLKDLKKEASEVKKEHSEIKNDAKVSHPCPECDKVFAQGCNLKTHMDLHKGIRPFKCSKCEKTYAQKGNCKTHEVKCLGSNNTTSKSESNDGKVKTEVISKNYSEDINNTAEEESQPEEDILKAIDDLEKPVEPKIEPPSEEDIIGAIENLENDVTIKPKENADVLKAIEQLQQSEIKPEITKKFTCQKCSYPAKTKYELDRHVKTKHEGPTYSCTFCDFNTTRKENLSLHLKTKHDKFLNLAKEVKKLTQNVVPINLPQNLKLTTVPSSSSAANPSAVSITKAPTSAKLASITKFAANVKKVASITKSTASTKNATINKSTAKVATITKSADNVKVATITKSTSKVDNSKKTSKLATKDELREIVSITPISKPAKNEVKEIVSITPVTKTPKVPASTAPQKIPVNKTPKVQISTALQKTGAPKLSEKQTPVKKLIGSNNNQNSPATSVDKKLIKSEGNIWKSNKHSELKNNVFKSDTSADKSNHLNLFEYDVRRKEETMLNLLTKAPIAKFSPDESSPLPPSPFLPLGSPSVMHVFGKQTISPIEEEEDKNPQEVDLNPREELATEVPSKFVDEDDEEEDFECKDCLTIFWFKSELYSHLRDAHGVKEPELVEQKKKQNQIAFKAKKDAESKLEQPKETALKTATPNIERKIPKNDEEQSKAVKPVETINAHSCTPCNFKSNRRQKLYQHMQTERHAQTIKDKDKSSNLPNKRKAEDETTNQNKGKSLKSNAPKIGVPLSTLKWPESSNMTQKVGQTKPENQNVKVAITPVQKASTAKSHNPNNVPRNSNSKVAVTKAQNPNPNVSKSSSQNLNNKASRGYSGVSITPVVTKLSNSASKQHLAQVPKQHSAQVPNNKIKQQPSAPVVTKLPNKTTKQQTPVPIVTKLTNKTAPKLPSTAVVTKLPNKTEKKPPLPVATTNHQSFKNQTPQKKLEVQRANIQNLRNKLKPQASEGGTNTARIKITPVPKKRPLPSSTEEPRSKVAKPNTVNIEVKDDDDDTADYSCKVMDCMESFWFPGQLKEHMTKIHKA